MILSEEVIREVNWFHILWRGIITKEIVFVFFLGLLLLLFLHRFLDNRVGLCQQLLLWDRDGCQFLSEEDVVVIVTVYCSQQGGSRH